MNKTERYDVILKILTKKKSTSPELLCKEVYCSLSTIRRDLIELQKMGLITYNKQNVSIILAANNEYSYKFRENENKKEKIYICNLAKDYIKDGFSLFLDSSSTVYYICNFLNEFSDISIVTNGISTLSMLCQLDNVQTYVTGGFVKNGTNSILGQSSSNFINEFKADLAILSCRGIDSEGIYEADQNQALIKQQMMQNAKSSILLCDSSKFNKSYFYKLCDFNSITTIITDKKPDVQILKSIISNNCKVLF